MHGATLDTKACGRKGEQAPVFPETAFILLRGCNFPTMPDLTEGVSAT